MTEISIFSHQTSPQQDDNPLNAARRSIHFRFVTPEKISHLNLRVQSLRGLAVLSVILFHFAESWIPNGWLGVDVFFIISGFVVSKQLLRIKTETLLISNWRANGYISFLIRRFFRLAPTLGAVIMISVLPMVLTTPPRTIQKFVSQSVLSLFGLGNIGAIKIVGDYFHSEPNPFVHTWSLGVEEQIYLLLGLIFFLRSIKRGKYSITINPLLIFTCVGCISLISFLYLATQNYENMQNQSLDLFNFYFMTQRIWEFCLGGIAFLIQKSKENLESAIYLILFATFFVVLAIVLLLKIVILDKYQLIILVNILTVTILLLQNSWTKTKILHPLIDLGNTSYSSYLLHMPLFYIARFSPLLSDGRNNKSIRIVMLVLTFFLAHILNRYVENKFRLSSKTKQISKKQIISIAVTSILVPAMILGCVNIAMSNSSIIPNKNVLQPDDPSKSLDKCRADTTVDYCVYAKDKTSNGVLLIGDSHARYLSKTFLELSKRNESTGLILTKSGCQFILPDYAHDKQLRKLFLTYNTKHIGERESCFQHNKKIVDFVKLHPDTQVLAVFRSSSMVEMDFGIDPAVYVPLLVKSLLSLVSEKRRLYILGPNPEFSDGNRFFAGNTIFWQNKYETNQKSSMEIERMLQNPFRDHTLIKKLTGDKNAFLINGLEPFCNERTCLRKQNGHWLYANVDHLSYWGTELMKKKLEIVFTKN